MIYKVVLVFFFFPFSIVIRRCLSSHPWILHMLLWWINSGILVAIRGARDSSSAVSGPSPPSACWGLRGPLRPGPWWTRRERSGWGPPCPSTGAAGSSPTCWLSTPGLWTSSASPHITTQTKPTESPRESVTTCVTSPSRAVGTSGSACPCDTGPNPRHSWVGWTRGQWGRGLGGKGDGLAIGRGQRGLLGLGKQWATCGTPESLPTAHCPPADLPLVRRPSCFPHIPTLATTTLLCASMRSTFFFLRPHVVRGRRHNYGWFVLLYGRNQHNVVWQFSSNQEVN